MFYFQTDWKAPKKQLIAIDTRKPDKKNWKTVIPEAKDKLQGANLVGGLFACTYLQDAKTQVKFFATTGTFVREVKFPAIGSAGGFGGKRTDTETFYTFTSFATPAEPSTGTTSSPARASCSARRR